MELPNSCPQVIDFNPSCSGQPHFNKFRLSHENESTELRCTLTVLRVPSTIRPLVSADAKFGEARDRVKVPGSRVAQR